MPKLDKTDWEEPREEEFISLDIPLEYRTLITEEKELSVRDLWSRFLSGELVLEPGFQRHYVWDKRRASRFIESLLLNLPVPLLFLAENPNSTLDVIDGHQRLETLFRFMQPLLTGPSGDQWRKAKQAFSPSLTLVGCEILDELNGRSVTALNLDDRAKLWEHKQKVILVKKESDEQMKFVLFARLNLGSMALNPQELRNCLYRGPHNDLIARLAEAPETLKIFGKREPDKRMGDRERVLRFFALAHRRDKYRIPFRSFLNDEMSANQYAPSDTLLRYRVEFEQALAWTQQVFPNNEFRMFVISTSKDPNGFWGRRMDILYDTEMFGFHGFRDRLEAIWNSLASKPPKRGSFLVGFRHRLIDVMVDNTFLQTFSEQTTAPHVVRRRFDLWLGAIQDVVDNWEKTSEKADKIVSFQRVSTACALCPQHIGATEDAVIVRLNGKESLAHRFCKQSRD